MTCLQCHRANLEGGVRCIYCGTHFPAPFEFDLGVSEPAPATPSVASMPLASPPPPQKSAPLGRAGFVGTLALLALKLKSLFAIFKFGKIATTFLTMLVFIAADAQLFGWKFGVGFAVIIFIHEMGHVFVNWRKGIPQTAPMFIPFVGAVIFVKRFPDDPTVESESGAGGPAAGLLAALGCLALGRLTGDRFWDSLASIGFLINLFNLVPFPPLDGSHIASVFSPKVWNAVLIAMLLWVIKVPSAMLWGVLMFGFIFRLGREDAGRHLLASPSVRIRMALVYLVLCLSLGYGAEVTIQARHEWARSLQPAPSASVGKTRSPRSRLTLPSGDTEEVTSRGELTPDPQREPTRNLVRGILISGLAAVWGFIAFAVSQASFRRLGARGILFAAGMMGVLLFEIAIYSVISSLNRHDLVLLIGAFLAATFGALFNAVYQWVTRLKQPDLSRTLRTARCLGWAAASALLVSYTSDNLSVALFVLALGAVFYLRFPWMLLGLAAGWAKGFGDERKALALYRRSLALCRDPESAARLHLEISKIALSNDWGSAGLEALEARAQLLHQYGTPEAASVLASIQELEARATALTLTERYDEALTVSEAILKAPHDDPLDKLRLIVVRFRIARIAFFQGWTDEGRAQMEVCLKAVSNLRPLQGLAQLRLAEAALAEGNLPEAKKSGDLAQSLFKEPAFLASVASVRAEIAARLNRPAEAEKEIQGALTQFPDQLEFKYRFGLILNAVGKLAQGEAVLRQLAQEFPQEHWGKQAGLALSETKGKGMAGGAQGRNPAFAPVVDQSRAQ